MDLEKIPAEELLGNLQSEVVKSAFKLIRAFEPTSSDKFDDTQLKRLFISSYGDDLFFDSRNRHLIYNYLLKEEEVNFLFRKYCDQENISKKYDKCLILSNKNWSVGSDFVGDVADILNLEEKYLPQEKYLTKSWEFIKPISDYFEPLDYQKQAINKICDLLKKESRLVLQMPTGSGKTKTCIESIILFLSERKNFERRKNILWLAHTSELCEQAIESLKKIWVHKGFYEVNFYRFYGSFNHNFSQIFSSFIFGSYQKFFNHYKNGKNDFLKDFKNIDLIIADEAHRSIAPTYKLALDSLLRNNPGSKLIGLTATPGRGIDDFKANKELSDFFEKNLVSPTFNNENPIEFLRKLKVLSVIKRITMESGVNLFLSDNLDEENELSDRVNKQILKKLSRNEKRNIVIINAIKMEVLKKNPTIVFTCSLEHSQVLNLALKTLGINSDYIDSGMSKYSRFRVIRQFQEGKIDVILNFGILTTGFDSPRIKTVLIARPTTSIVLYSQMIGRGLRGERVGGTEYCNLIDIKDNLENFGDIEDVYNYFSNFWK